MNRFWFMPLIFLSALISPRGLGYPCATGTYHLLCRGKQTLGAIAANKCGTPVGTPDDMCAYIEIFAGTNAKKAGPFGEYLALGKCAWEDRAFNSTENPTIDFRMLGPGAMALTPILYSCLADATCVLDMCGKSELGRIYVRETRVQTYFPTFKP